MANNSVKISAQNACTAPEANSFLVLVGNTAGTNTSYKVTLNNLYINAAANLSINVGTTKTIVVTGNTTPANNTDNSSRPAGSIWSDGSYIYYYDGAAIKRTALSSF